MIKKLLPILLFGLAYLINLSHYWFNDDPNKLYNWIIFKYKPMNLAWNVSYVSHQVVIPLLVMIAIGMILKRINVKGLYLFEYTIYKWFTILNSISYFLIFNSGELYLFLYWILGFIGAYFWCKNNNCEEDNAYM